MTTLLQRHEQEKVNTFHWFLCSWPAYSWLLQVNHRNILKCIKFCSFGMEKKSLKRFRRFPYLKKIYQRAVCTVVNSIMFMRFGTDTLNSDLGLKTESRVHIRKPSELLRLLFHSWAHNCVLQTKDDKGLVSSGGSAWSFPRLFNNENLRRIIYSKLQTADLLLRKIWAHIAICIRGAISTGRVKFIEKRVKCLQNQTNFHPQNFFIPNTCKNHRDTKYFEV